MTNSKRTSQRGRSLVLGAAAALGLTLVAAGQTGQTGQPAAPARTQMDELLAEVRALRADLDRAAASSMRGQLLGMRLQVQEQRIADLMRQLSTVQQRLRENAAMRSALEGPLKMFGGMKPGQTAGEMDVVLGPVKEQLTALDNSDVELKAEEAALTARLNEEQSRWSTFNSQIEEMERAAAGRVKP